MEYVLKPGEGYAKDVIAEFRREGVAACAESSRVEAERGDCMFVCVVHASEETPHALATTLVVTPR